MLFQRLSTVAVAAMLALLVACKQEPTKPAPAEEGEQAEEQAAEPEAVLPENAKPLSEIVAAVQAKGYGPVVEIELDEDRWEIDAFKGEERVELNVDPVSGEIASGRPEVSGKPLPEILSGVEAQGYGPIIEVELDDEGWEIDAIKNGEEVSLIADPETGQIRVKEEEHEEKEEAEE